MTDNTFFNNPAELNPALVDEIEEERAAIQAENLEQSTASDPEQAAAKIGLPQVSDFGELVQEVKDHIDKQPAPGQKNIYDFWLRVTSEKRIYEGIKTGLSYYDRITEGGLMRGELVTLGAAPGAGKTMFAQMLFEGMIINNPNVNVMYINLEMTTDQLLARSMSRILWTKKGKDYKAKDILRGYNWTIGQTEEVRDCMAYYKDHIAPRFTYNPEHVTNDIDSIIMALTAEADRLTSEGKAAPIVCIDYLQLITTSKKADASEGIKEVIAKLKDFARKYNTCVFVIIANNRASNETGTASVTSGRDTSAIEYSGDTMLTLSYTAVEKHRRLTPDDADILGVEIESTNSKGETVEKKQYYTLERIKLLKILALERGFSIPAVCNNILLKVVKSRFDGDGRQVELNFDGRHATFTEISDRY